MTLNKLSAMAQNRLSWIKRNFAFKKIQLDGVDLSRQVLARDNMDIRSLRGTNFSGSSLRSSNFSGNGPIEINHLQRTRWHNTNAMGADLSYTALQGAELASGKFRMSLADYKTIQKGLGAGKKLTSFHEVSDATAANFKGASLYKAKLGGKTPGSMAGLPDLRVAHTQGAIMTNPSSGKRIVPWDFNSAPSQLEKRAAKALNGISHSDLRQWLSRQSDAQQARTLINSIAERDTSVPKPVRNTIAAMVKNGEDLKAIKTYLRSDSIKNDLFTERYNASQLPTWEIKKPNRNPNFGGEGHVVHTG